MIDCLLTEKKALFSDGANTELRLQRNRNRRVSFLNGNPVGNVRTETKGVSARVYADGVYGFASMAEDSCEAVESVLRAASENAAFLSRHAGRGKRMLPPLAPGKLDTALALNDVEQRRYIEYAKEVDEYIKKTYPDLLSRSVVLSADSIEKQIVVSNGTDSCSSLPRSYVYLFLTGETKDGRPVELFDVVGGFGTFDVNFKSPADCFPTVDKLYRRLREKCEGVYPEAGEKTVILGGILSGMLAHEAVGHTVEADLVLAGSVAAHSLGKRVASEKITMVDFAHTALGERVPLPIYSDDEGTPATDAMLIQEGILTGYMNSRETAEHFGMTPTGNARAFLFSDEPLIRMRNTAILPGSDKLEEMIASVEDGYYFLDTNNGQADTTGEFMFGVTGGYEIKKGKLGRAILDTTISGVAFEMLKTVDMVSDRMVWASSGMCGKKQPMPVGMGGPALRCRVTVGGR